MTRQNVSTESFANSTCAMIQIELSKRQAGCNCLQRRRETKSFRQGIAAQSQRECHQDLNLVSVNASHTFGSHPGKSAPSKSPPPDFTNKSNPIWPKEGA